MLNYLQNGDKFVIAGDTCPRSQAVERMLYFEKTLNECLLSGKIPELQYCPFNDTV